MMRRVLLGLAAITWGAASFGAGLYLTFPEEDARVRVVHEVAERSKNEYAIDMESLSLWRLSGVDLDGVKLYTVKKGRKTKDEPDPPHVRTLSLELDRLAARVQLLPLLWGKQTLAFLAEIYGGSIDGTYAQSEGAIALAFEAERIDLSQIPAGEGANSFLFRGTLQGSADLDLDTADPKNSTGTLRLDFPGFGLGKGSKVSGFELPEVIFDSATLGFEAKDGKLSVTEGSFQSSALTATVSGDIALNKRFARSRLRLDVVFTLPEDLDQLAQLAPDLKRARDEDGQYHYMISGTLQSPNARPSRSGGRVARPGAEKGGDDGPALGGGLPGPGRDFSPDMSPEDRRAAREERIRERRERMRKRREEADRDNPLLQDRPGPDEDLPPPGGPDDDLGPPMPMGPDEDLGPPPLDEGPMFDEEP
jgi:type II secretion system protein N